MRTATQTTVSRGRLPNTLARLCQKVQFGQIRVRQQPMRIEHRPAFVAAVGIGKDDVMRFAGLMQEFGYTSCRVFVPSARTDEVRPSLGKITIFGNFYESMGILVKTGLVDKQLVFQFWADQVIGAWERLAPVAAIARRRLGDVAWKNFEYLTVLSQDWLAAHPKGSYPAGARRIELKDEWLEADKQYAASLAPA